MRYLKTGIRIYGKRTVCRYGHAAKVKKIILSLLPEIPNRVQPWVERPCGCIINI
jgi:hypothetical protein